MAEKQKSLSKNLGSLGCEVHMRKDLRENDSTQKAHIAKSNMEHLYSDMVEHPKVSAIRKLRTKPYDIQGCNTLPIPAKRNH